MAEPAFSLHAPTVLFVTALVVAFSGGLMMFAKGRRRDADAIGFWGAAMLLASLGFVLAGMGQDVPWLSDGVGHGRVPGGDIRVLGRGRGCSPSVRRGRG